MFYATLLFFEICLHNSNFVAQHYSTYFFEMWRNLMGHWSNKTHCAHSRCTSTILYDKNGLKVPCKSEKGNGTGQEKQWKLRKCTLNDRLYKQNSLMRHAIGFSVEESNLVSRRGTRLDFVGWTLLRPNRITLSTVMLSKIQFYQHFTLVSPAARQRCPASGHHFVSRHASRLFCLRRLHCSRPGLPKLKFYLH